MKKELKNFEVKITKMELNQFKGGWMMLATCGETTPNTSEQSSWHGHHDAEPDSYCDDD